MASWHGLALAFLLSFATAPLYAAEPADSLLQMMPPPLRGQAPLLDSEAIPTPPPAREIVPLSGPVTEQDIKVQETNGLISLSVRNASLRQVVALVADTQKLNLVFASPDDVAVTATFDQVPWQQALDSLLSATAHTWTDNGGIIFVTNNTLAAMVAPQAGGRQVHVFELDFASAVDIEQTVQGLISPAGRAWVLESSTEDNRRTREAVAVVDYPANLSQIADYICQADQPPRQVLIEAHILQIELKDDCRNGVIWEQILGMAGNQGKFGFLSPGVLDPSAPAIPVNGITDPGQFSTSFILIDTPKLASIVEFLQSTTDAKTLASPKLLAVSGQEAKINIGDEIGYNESITNPNQTTQQSVKFLETGVILSVTPRITRDGRVLMKVLPEVSTGAINPETNAPDKRVTKVETDLLLEDGFGMVIGGLIQETDSNIQNKVPWLGDIPYAGVLFQRRQVVKSRKEIIVTIIPHVLPYTPILAQQNAHEYMRADQPLTVGPLDRFPRPYEPRMPDTFTNPRTICENIERLPPLPQRPQIVRLPPVGRPMDTCPVDDVRAEDITEADIQIEEARRGRTLYR